MTQLKINKSKNKILDSIVLSAVILAQLLQRHNYITLTLNEAHHAKTGLLEWAGQMSLSHGLDISGAVERMHQLLDYCHPHISC